MITLENDCIALAVDPQFGGRITTLLDKRTGRNWLVPDNGQDQDPEAASFASQAWGWDECFPCLEAQPGTTSAWQRPLRHHGDLWGRPALARLLDRRTLCTTWRLPEYRFARVVRLAGDTIHCAYRVASASSRALPFLYSQHALLVLPAGESIRVRGPDGNLLWSVVIPPIETGTAEKLYREVAPGSSIQAGGHQGTIVYSFGQAGLPAVGLWLNFGGWPNGSGTHHVAVEPTTATGHDPVAVSARTLLPGHKANWTVDLHLRVT